MNDLIVYGVVGILSVAAVLTVCISFYAGLRVGRDQGYQQGRVAGIGEGRVLERGRIAGERFDQALESAEEALAEAAAFPTTFGGHR